MSINDSRSGSSGPVNGVTGKVNYDWIKESWSIFMRSPGVWIVGFILTIVLTISISLGVRILLPAPVPAAPAGTDITSIFMTAFVRQITSANSIVTRVLNWLVTSFMMASLSHMAVKSVRREPLEYKDIFSGGPYYLNSLLLVAIVNISTVLGTVALCFGAFVAMAFFLPSYAMVADGIGLGESISRSFHAIKRDWMNASFFSFIFVMLTIISLLPCLLGLLATGPMYYIASALAYRDMVGMPGIAAQPSVPSYGAAQPGVWPPPPNVPQTRPDSDENGHGT